MGSLEGEEILRAVCQGKRQEVKHLLQTGQASPDAIDRFGTSALVRAIEHKDVVMVQHLLESGASSSMACWWRHCQTKCDVQVQPIEVAVHMQNEEIVRLLLEHGCHESDWGKWKVFQDPVLIAVRNGSKGLVRILVNHGFDMYLGLHGAILEKDTAMLDLLIKLGADLNNEDLVPLVIAANNEDIELCSHLIELGASLNGPIGKLGESPLIIALWRGLTKAVPVLLSLGCDVNVRCMSHLPITSLSPTGALKQSEIAGASPLHMAVAKQYVHIVNPLIKAGCKVNSPDTKGNTSLHIACQQPWVKKSSSLIKELLKHQNEKKEENVGNDSLELDSMNHAGLTPLALAVQSRNIDAVRMLVEAGACANLCAGLLHKSVCLGSEDLVVLMLHAGCDVNGHDVDCATPIQLAIRNKDYTITDMLIDAGADLTVYTKTKANMVHLAAECASEDILELVITHLSRPKKYINARDEFLNTPLMLAVRRPDGHLCCQVLIDCGAFLNCQDANGETALSSSIYFGSERCAEILISQGANLDLVDKRVTSPMYWAIFNARVETIKQLVVAGSHLTLKMLQGYPKNLTVKRNAQLYKWLLTMVTEPRSLQDICGLAIRRCLVSHAAERGIYPLINCLCLPQKLKDYLRFERHCDSYDSEL